MDVSLVAQPYRDHSNLGDFLARVVDDSAFSELRVCVAWAKASGLSKVRPLIEHFKQHGTLEIVIGISEGGATQEGLELAAELADRAYVLYDPTGRTFHPKLYLASGDNDAAAFIGSNNLTAGGVYFNYEVAVECRMDLSVQEDLEFKREIDEILDRYISDTAICKPLDEDLILRLTKDERYRIGSEEVRRRPSESSKVGESADQIFGKSHYEKSKTWKEANKFARKPPLISEEDFQRQISEVVSSTIVKRWWKKMSSSDAQRPPRPDSNVTGKLRLTQRPHPIDHTTYFRHELFGELTWTSRDDTSGTEFVIISMEFMVDGESQGVEQFMIDHNQRRVAGQGNVPTVLAWGPRASRLLRSGNYVGHYAVVEKLVDGRFRLLVQPDEPSEFLP